MDPYVLSKDGFMNSRTKVKAQTAAHVETRPWPGETEREKVLWRCIRKETNESGGKTRRKKKEQEKTKRMECEEMKQGKRSKKEIRQSRKHENVGGRRTN